MLALLMYGLGGAITIHMIAPVLDDALFAAIVRKRAVAPWLVIVGAVVAWPLFWVVALTGLLAREDR